MDYYHTSSFETDIDNQELADIPNEMFDMITSPSLYFDTTHIPARPPASSSSTSSYSTDPSESPIDMPEFNEDHMGTINAELDQFGAQPPLGWPTVPFQGPSHPHFHTPFSEATVETTMSLEENLSHLVISASDLVMPTSFIDPSEYLTNMPDFDPETTAMISSLFQQQSYPNLQQHFSDFSDEDIIATDLVSQEGIPPSHVFSAPQPHPDLQQQAGPPRRFPCHCGRS